MKIEPAPSIELLHRHLRESLCGKAWRPRKAPSAARAQQSLPSLARFCLAVILEPPPALAQLPEPTRRPDPTGLLPTVLVSDSAFSQKCGCLSSEFLQSLHIRYMQEVPPPAPQCYCRQFSGLRESFSTALVLDASRLDKIAHRL